MGGAFSEEINNENTQNTIPTREQIASSKENLKNSVGSLQSKIDSARAENEKGLAGLKLELIQLMEQGYFSDLSPLPLYVPFHLLYI